MTKKDKKQDLLYLLLSIVLRRQTVFCLGTSLLAFKAWLNRIQVKKFFNQPNLMMSLSISGSILSLDILSIYLWQHFITKLFIQEKNSKNKYKFISKSLRNPVIPHVLLLVIMNWLACHHSSDNCFLPFCKRKSI